MGKRKRGQHDRHHKRRKKSDRFWIDKVKETKGDSECDLLVWISRSESTDLHTFQPPTDEKEGEDKTTNCSDNRDEETDLALSTVPKVRKDTTRDKPKISIRFQPSRLRARKSFTTQHYDFRHLPNGDCGDGIINPTPDVVADRYWAQRKRFFSKFDEGIQIDREGWYSVTPEAIADHIADRLVSGKQNLVVLDAFVGVGANALALAKRPEVSLVVGVDTDEERIKLAANNCRVYGIDSSKIVFIRDDAVNVLSSYEDGKRKNSVTQGDGDKVLIERGYKIGGRQLLPNRLDILFLSPPWGGENYVDHGAGGFRLSHIRVNDNTDGEALLQKALHSLRPNASIAYYLPRNLDGQNTAHFVSTKTDLKSLEFEQNLLNDKFKTITMYNIDTTNL